VDGWAGCRTSLDDVEKEKLVCTCKESLPSSAIIQPVQQYRRWVPLMLLLLLVVVVVVVVVEVEVVVVVVVVVVEEEVVVVVVVEEEVVVVLILLITVTGITCLLHRGHYPVLEGWLLQLINYVKTHLRQLCFLSCLLSSDDK
jgi:hypothetical protein